MSNANCKKAEVLDWSEASVLDLDVTKDSFESAPNSLGDNVWGWVVGDKSKGIQTTEKMLLNGTTLTAIGELAISTQTGDIKVQAPSSGENYYLVKVRILRFPILSWGSLIGLDVIRIGFIH